MAGLLGPLQQQQAPVGLLSSTGQAKQRSPILPLEADIRRAGAMRLNPLVGGFSPEELKFLQNLPPDMEMIYDDGSPAPFDKIRPEESVIVRPKQEQAVPTS